VDPEREWALYKRDKSLSLLWEIEAIPLLDRILIS
jgi:hypothetical protein